MIHKCCRNTNPIVLVDLNGFISGSGVSFGDLNPAILRSLMSSMSAYAYQRGVSYILAKLVFTRA